LNEPVVEWVSLTGDLFIAGAHKLILQRDASPFALAVSINV